MLRGRGRRSILQSIGEIRGKQCEVKACVQRLTTARKIPQARTIHQETIE